MRLGILLLLITTIHFGFAQKTKKVKNITEDYFEYYHVLKDSKEVRHGDYFKRSRSGILLEAGEYSNGIKNGEWTKRHGAIYNKYYYKQGKLDSFDGIIESERVKIKYDANEQPIHRIKVTESYIEHQNFDISGGLYAVVANNDTIVLGTYVNWLKHGTWYYKNQNNTFCQFNYSNGKLVGKQQSYYPDGNVFRTEYRNNEGDLSGPCVILYSNSDTLCELNYKDGKLHGPVKAWYPTAGKFCEGWYEEGKLMEFTEFDKSGFVRKNKVSNGKGIVAIYNQTGQVKKELKVINGLPKGDTSMLELSFEHLSEIKSDGMHDAISNDIHYTIANEITYPSLALENDITGVVRFKIKINRSIAETEYEVISRKLGFGLEEEALRVLKYASKDWQVPVIFGFPQVGIYSYPIKFQIF